MKTNGKVIITPRPPVSGGDSQDEGGNVVLKCAPVRMEEIIHAAPGDPNAAPDPAKKEAPDLRKVAKDLKDKAKVECKSAKPVDKKNK